MLCVDGATSPSHFTFSLLLLLLISVVDRLFITLADPLNSTHPFFKSSASFLNPPSIMSSSLDMALGDIIQNNRKAAGGAKKGRGGIAKGAGAASGRVRRTANRQAGTTNQRKPGASTKKPRQQVSI